MTIWYVDPVSGNDGTAVEDDSDNPRATIPSPPAAGKTYSLKRGTTLTVTSQINMTNDSVTINAYGTGDSPVISCELSVTNAEPLRVAGTGYTLQDLIIKGKAGCNRNLILFNKASGTLLIKDCEIYDAYSTGGGGGTCVWQFAASTLTIDGCTIHDADSDIILAAGSLVLLNSHLYAPAKVITGGDCVQLNCAGGASANTRIAGNTLDRRTTNASADKQVILIQDDTVASATGIVIENNRIIGPTTGTCTLTYIQATNPIIRGNTFVGGIKGHNIDGAGHSIYGNVFDGQTSVGVRTADADNGSTHYIYNNTFVGMASGITDEGGNPTITVEEKNNAYDGVTTQWTGGGNVTRTQSNNVSGTGIVDSNYNPVSTSLLGTGVWIAGVRAYDDLPLPLHPDIGAVQDRNAAGRKFGVSGNR